MGRYDIKGMAGDAQRNCVTRMWSYVCEAKLNKIENADRALKNERIES